MTEQPWRRNIRRLGWVRELKTDGGRCEGYRSGRPVRQTPELREKYRCKKPARWSYRFLWSQWTYGDRKTVRFCSSHLYASGVDSWMQERLRMEKWFNKHGVI